MRKRLQQALSLVLAVAFVLAVVVPAGAAGELKLEVNGEAAQADLILQNGTTLIELGSLEAINGAEVQVKEGDAQVINGKKYVPLRSVADSLGFQVNWTPGLISLERAVQEEASQVIDGLTAMDVLVKSNQAAQEINTYSMSGHINQKMMLDIDGETLPVDMTSEIFGHIQNEPMKIYMKQTIVLPEEAFEGLDEEAAGLLGAMEVETYMDEEFMYIKTPDQEGWLKQPHFLPMELLKEQQQITNDPLQAAEQMLEMGFETRFGENVVIDGQECYTISANIDMAKALESQQELLREVMGSVGQMTVAELGGEMDPAMMDAFSQLFELIMNKIIEDGVLDYQVTMFVDKETFLPAQMNLEISMKLDINVQEFVKVIAEAIGEEISEEDLAELQTSFKFDIVQQGEIRMFGFGEEFVAPDLTNVIDLDAVPVE